MAAMEPVEKGSLEVDCKTSPVRASASCNQLTKRIAHTIDLENGRGDVMVVLQNRSNYKTLHGLLISSEAMLALAHFHGLGFCL